MFQVLIRNKIREEEASQCPLVLCANIGILSASLSAFGVYFLKIKGWCYSLEPRAELQNWS